MSSRAKRKQAARAARPPEPPAVVSESKEPEVSGAALWMGALCYLNLLLLIPACTRWRKDAFVRFHLNQGLVLLILFAAFVVIGFVPYCFEFALSCCILVEILSLVGLVSALRRKTDPMPVIQNVTRNFHPF